jgi:hypothetical protein
MKPLVLLILAVVWAVALIPPLLRSRSELRPGSSVASFRRTLSDMSRIPGRAGYPGMGGPANPASPVRAFRGAPSQAARSRTGVQRIGSSPYATPPGYGYSPGLARARANRAAMIRRRQNVLFTLVTAVVITGIAGFALGAVVMRTAFFICLILLALYVWMLATLRRNEELRSAHRYVYSDAA